MTIWRDPRLRLTFGLSLVMALMLLVALNRTEKDDRIPLVVFFVGVMALIQTAILLRGSRQRGVLAKAQQAFVNGNYEEAASLLEDTLVQTRQNGRVPDVKMLTVLGNTYRQLGQLAKSEALLREAVEKFQGQDFPIYGLGRTRLAQGDYAEAALLIEQALAQGSRKVIRADLALALFYGGADSAKVIETARQATRVLNLENYRALMVNYILYKNYNEGSQQEIELAKRVIRNMVAGLIYWQGEAKRHATTPYGQRLAADLAEMETILNDGA
jgi:tetratricopeptide (TPR) repeat protein